MRTNDVLSARKFSPVDLRGTLVRVSPETLLALWIFVARHGAPNAEVRMIATTPDDR